MSAKLPKNSIQIKTQIGFTLIEIILYIALLSIMLSGAIAVAWDMIYGRVKVRTQQELNHQVRFAMTRINYEIRNASGINTVSANSISLVQADSSRNPVVIDLVAGRLRIGWGNSGPCAVSAPCFLTSSDVNITGLTFTNFSSGGSKQIQTQFSASTSGARSEYQASQTLKTSAEIQSD